MTLAGAIDLRLGDWQAVLCDVATVDALITDAPFGPRVHAGSRAFGRPRADGAPLDGLGPGYDAWTEEHVGEFVAAWAPRVRGWFACMASHDMTGWYQRAYQAAGLYAFAPVPLVIRGMSVRLAGDGPSSWSVYLMVARPRTQEFSRWGTLPGAYVVAPSRGAKGGRGKPRALLEAIVRDYSRAGDLVCDPLAGWGSTLIAAAALGRRAVGAERDEDAHAEALTRIREAKPSISTEQ